MTSGPGADVDGDPGLGPYLTVPNAITLVRLMCVPLFLYLLFGVEERYAAAWLLGGLGATDWVDGWFARKFDQTSEFGKLFDPTADRIMLLTAVVSIAVDGSVPWWFAIATLAREGGVALAALACGALGVRRFEVTWWGKCGTFFLMFSYPFFLASHADISWAGTAEVLAWVFGIPGLIYSYLSAAQYFPVLREALANRSAAT